MKFFANIFCNNPLLQALFPEKGRIRIRIRTSGWRIRIRIMEVQKHPDPQHCFEQRLSNLILCDTGTVFSEILRNFKNDAKYGFF